MSTSARRRLMRDYKRVMLDPPVGIIAAPEPADMLQWTAVIFGPEDTPWEGGTFKLQMKFSEEYPNKPPIVKFVTKLFHPNVYATGDICLDILANQWSPIYDVGAILASIQSLLTDPNPNSPANVEAAKLYVENRREYDRKVAEVIEAMWKTEEQENSDEDDEEEEDDEKHESDDEDSEAPRKKQKLSETSALHTNTSTVVTTTPAAASSTATSLPSPSISTNEPTAASAASASASSTPAAASQ